MDDEMRALKKKKIRQEIVDLPKGKKTIGCKWIYTIKYIVMGPLNDTSKIGC